MSKKNFFNSILAMFLVQIIIIIYMIINNYSPFGDYSFAIVDAKCQVLDMLVMLRNVIIGKESFIFSLTDGLGLSSFVTYSYNLSSPIYLLFIFFKSSEVIEFYNIAVILKLSLCAFTMSYYLNNRFNYHINNYLNIILSLSYAFISYNINNSYNLMWIDGVYMLPLIFFNNVYN